jgi:hypothetical protein
MSALEFVERIEKHMAHLSQDGRDYKFASGKMEKTSKANPGEIF